jgi:hypothetical protein
VPLAATVSRLDALDVTGDRTETRIIRRLQLAMTLLSIPIIELKDRGTIPTYWLDR